MKKVEALSYIAFVFFVWALILVQIATSLEKKAQEEDDDNID